MPMTWTWLTRDLLLLDDNQMLLTLELDVVAISREEDPLRIIWRYCGKKSRLELSGDIAGGSFCLELVGDIAGEAPPRISLAI